MSESNLPKRPVLTVAIRPKDPADREKLASALSVLIREDVAIQAKMDSANGQTMIGGETDLDLEVIFNRILTEYGIPLEFGQLRVTFLETIGKHAESEGKYIRQTGGRGNYGHCKLRIEPRGRGTGYEFIDDIRNGALPERYVASIDEGVRRAMESGVLAGHPVVDIKITLIDGSYHDTDSNEMAFRHAAALAFTGAARRASPIPLEPVMAVEITTPAEYMGMIVRDLSSRRARIEDIARSSGSPVIKAVAPLAEMIGYGRILRSKTDGRANPSMRFIRYEAAPPRDDPDDSEAGITANKPTGPRGGSGFASDGLEEEST
jgi:elongation factor G